MSITRVQPPATPPFWIEVDVVGSSVTPVRWRDLVTGEIFTALDPDPVQPGATYDPASVADCWARQLDRNSRYHTAMMIVEALYPEGVETSRLDVGELVTITIYAPDVAYGVWVVTEVAKVISTADVAVSAVQG